MEGRRHTRRPTSRSPLILLGFATSAPPRLSRACPPWGTRCVARRHIPRSFPQNAPLPPALTRPYIPKTNPAAYISVQMVLPSVISPSLTIRSASLIGIATRSMNSSRSYEVSPSVRFIAA